MSRSATRKKLGEDKHYLAWLHTQPCIVTGRSDVTVHHVRFFGSLRDDRRGVPLVQELHQLGWRRRISGPPCVEDGKEKFERFYGVDLEAEIVRLNRKYEMELAENGIALHRR